VPCPAADSRPLPQNYVNHDELPDLDFRYYPELGMCTMSWPVNDDNMYDPVGTRKSKPIIVFNSAIRSIEFR
jgi:hypothetical protein